MPICSPYRVPLFLFFLVAACPFANAADLKQTEKVFEQRYVGKILNLRGFYPLEFLDYRSDGTPKFKAESGPWTVFGRIEITDFKLKKDRISIRGNRVLVAWEQTKGSDVMKYYRARPVQIDADVDQEPEEAIINRLLPHIFIGAPDRLEDLVPSHWHDYLVAKRAALPPGALAPVKSSPDSKTEGSAEALTGNPSLATDKDMPSGTIRNGRLMKKVQPVYPDLPKALNLSGDLVFLAVIGKDGSVAKLSVKRPLGLGLEESAIEAVGKWKYEPYLVDGEPVEVETTITVRYLLAKR